MFIETGCEQDPRSSGAQYFRQRHAIRFSVSLLERVGIFELARSINITSLRDVGATTFPDSHFALTGGPNLGNNRHSRTEFRGE